ncbi:MULTISPECIES: Smr/MutS family protein [unclassified Paracoccus (in: a-proteobacteria)]|uniref:Smr/MutS family protein n=1 Tax=unclassified Paracoccus (in: a-proteobacteria) TaxID=2688777 RepID=UPI00160227A4|nr:MULTISPECIES: Smr/MutS family protein [unclassified Paracoccus (in: a-proteobacteria)]MBB1492085.1 Smr/MutS family protein [Paracoccus sp. MC1854]MBB1497971.1 Smr/MutS family protein [Paracoccus sp. MC1862]QQO44355.1 Smr/MutS family protein [Paracoccus sp. MC1862]
MSRRRGRGGLSEDDKALWAQVARSVTPMAATERRRIVAPPLEPAPPALTAPAPRPAALPQNFSLGRDRPSPPVHVAVVPSTAERLAAQPLRMDAKTHRTLTRGKMRPDARIDLHGMTLAVAKAELTGFILGAQAVGHRLVLVITGKGRGDHGPLPFRSGALRHEVPHWLQMAPVSPAVLQVVPAHVRHGGGGAYYVWLRRPRGGRRALTLS